MGILCIISHILGSDCCWLISKPFPNSTTKVSITFPSIIELVAFKNECACDAIYVERDALLLVGSFTEEQLQIANYKYAATFEIMKE